MYVLYVLYALYMYIQPNTLRTFSIILVIKSKYKMKSNGYDLHLRTTSKSILSLVQYPLNY